MIEGPPLEDTPSLLGAFARNASARPHMDAIRFLADGDGTHASIGFDAFRGDVEEVAAGLVERGLAGRPVLLALPPGIGFAIAVMACLRAGVIAVPTPVPHTGTAKGRLELIVVDARPAAVLIEAGAASEWSLPFAADQILTLAELRETATLPDEPSPSASALIQYSSGSTGSPKGIVVTHGNLAANLAMIRDAFQVTPDDVGVSWLPPSHDMGLIGVILGSLYVGNLAVLMPPLAFVRRPLRWLRAIADHGGTIAGSPNFGFEICTRRVEAEAVADLDLRRWRIAFCGSEPIRAPTLHRFAHHFASAGFDSSAFLPCYGMAETTLLCTAGRLREVEEPAANVVLSRVSCGRPVAGCAVEILSDPNTAGSGRGEIAVSGPHVSPGRWSGIDGRVVPHEGAFETADGRTFLRSGDIGRIEGGELVVLDRLKDMIITRGRKVAAIDVEQPALEAADGIVAAAAFSVPDEDREQVVVLCELSRRAAAQVDRVDVTQALRSAIGAATGVSARVILLDPGSLPRTASGKIRRQAARSGYLALAKANAARPAVA